jgi:PIN domain nuclease of toxin-antitoxin system
LPHLVRLAELPLHHRDPFDRMLAAQALAEGVPIVTGDPRIGVYGPQVLWG